jgi:hypothetical protein
MHVVLVSDLEAQRKKGAPLECPSHIVQPTEDLVVTEPPLPVTIHSPELFVEGVNLYDLGTVTATERDQVNNVPAGVLHTGYVREILDGPLESGDAVSTVLENGESLLTLAIRSPGAYGLRIHFEKFDVGSGSVLLYSDVDHGAVVRGPYSGTGLTRDGDFWTPSMPSDTVYIEVTGLEEPPRFEVTEIVHYHVDPGGFAGRTADRQVQGGPLACHIDANCLGDIHESSRLSTGRLNYIENGGSFLCSGTLLNDFDNNTVVPFLLTARHCIASEAVADTLETTWHYRTTTCDGSPPDLFGLPFNYGAWVVATNADNDMTLLRLDGVLPPDIGLSGWNTNTGEGAYGVHHPAGSWQRGVYISGVGLCPECEFCAASADYDFYDYDNGLTEGGSSGSGVFNSNGQLTGQLRGTCCFDLDCDGSTIACNTIDNFTAYYGEFEETYPIIIPHLQIGGTLYVDKANINPPWIGTAADPYFSVFLAHNAAFAGLFIRIESGIYNETLTLNKQVTLLAEGGMVTIGQ